MKQRIEKLKSQLLKNKILILLFILNLVLNLIGINFGLPQRWHPDEVTHTAGKMIAEKTLNPQRFIYPSFYIYSVIFVNLPYVFFLVLSGDVNKIFTDYVFKESVISNLFLNSRLLTAFVGAIGVIYIYKLSKRINPDAGLIAPALYSVTAGIIIHSHFATTDIPVTVLSLISMYSIIRLYESPTHKHYLFSGLLLGISAGTKYYAALLSIPLFIAHWFKAKKINFNLVSCAAVSIIAFFLTTPYAILDFSGFFKDMAYLFSSRAQFGTMYDPVSWFSYIFHMENAFGTPLFAVAVAGLFFAIFNLKKQKILILVSFVAIYLLMILRWHISFMRYLIILIPYLLIFSSMFLEKCLASIKFKKIMQIIVVLLFLYSLFYSIKADFLFISDSRYEAAAWIQENIPNNKTILVFSRPFYLPAITNKSNLYYLNLEDFNSTQEIISEIELINPEYIIDSSLNYDRYMTYEAMYPRRSQLHRIIPFKSLRQEITGFYDLLFSERLPYSKIYSAPGSKKDIPDPEFINPELHIFRRN